MSRKGFLRSGQEVNQDSSASTPGVEQQPPVVDQAVLDDPTTLEVWGPPVFDQEVLDRILQVENILLKIPNYLGKNFATKKELLGVTSFTLGQMALQGNLFCKQFADKVECNDLLTKFQQSMDYAGKDQTIEQHEGVG